MRIVQKEEIYISVKESDTYLAFSQIVERLLENSKNPNNKKVLKETSKALKNFLAIIKGIEQGGN